MTLRGQQVAPSARRSRPRPAPGAGRHRAPRGEAWGSAAPAGNRSPAAGPAHRAPAGSRGLRPGDPRAPFSPRRDSGPPAPARPGPGPPGPRARAEAPPGSRGPVLPRRGLRSRGARVTHRRPPSLPPSPAGTGRCWARRPRPPWRSERGGGGGAAAALPGRLPTGAAEAEAAAAAGSLVASGSAPAPPPVTLGRARLPLRPRGRAKGRGGESRPRGLRATLDGGGGPGPAPLSARRATERSAGAGRSVPSCGARGEPAPAGRQEVPRQFCGSCRSNPTSCARYGCSALRSFACN